MVRALEMVAVLALAVVVGCGKAGGSAGGKVTPEATFESFKTSMKAKDYKGAFANVAPDSQAMALGGMAMVVNMASQDPNMGPEAGKILEKHSIKPVNAMQLMMSAAGGSNPEAEIKKSVADTKDKPAAFEEILLWLEKNAPQTPGESNPMERMSEAVLTDVKIENDTATGTVKIKGPDGKEQSEPAKFRKIDGVWLIEFETPAAPGAQPAGDLPPGAGPNFTPPALPDPPEGAATPPSDQ